MPKPTRDLVGEVFGRLTVTKMADRRSSVKDTCWECVCECGQVTIVRAQHLVSHRTRSCGCLLREQRLEQGKRFVERLTKHGCSPKSGRTPTYRSWDAAKERCFNPKKHDYASYGGRGITMCARWRNSFAHFLADMGERPPGTSLDRWPNNNGNYEPGNCRWATPKEQQANRRPTPFRIAIDAERLAHLRASGLSMQAIGNELGVCYETVRRRLLRDSQCQR